MGSVSLICLDLDYTFSGGYAKSSIFRLVNLRPLSHRWSYITVRPLYELPINR